MTVTFEVLNAQWGCGDEPGLYVFDGGVHTVEKPSLEFLTLLAGAEAAGSVRVLDAKKAHRDRMDRAVQSQEDGEAAYVASQADGSWHKGNLMQFEIDVANGVRDGEL